jgi:hypothetical protein
MGVRQRLRARVKSLGVFLLLALAGAGKFLRVAEETAREAKSAPRSLHTAETVAEAARSGRSVLGAARATDSAKAARLARAVYGSQLEHEASVLRRFDRNAEAARRLDARAICEKANGDAVDVTSAAAHEKTASSVRSEHSPEPGASETFHDVISRLSQDQSIFLRDLDEVARRRIGSISFVETDVKQFAKDFEEGARNSGKYIGHPDLGSPQLKSDWENVPKEKRVFIIGAGEDLPQITNYMQQLAEDGYFTVFYRNWLRANGSLSDPRVIGALFRESGHTLVVESVAAGKSRFVPSEVLKAHQLSGHTSLVIMISPDDIKNALRAAPERAATIMGGARSLQPARVRVAVAGMMPTPDPSTEDLEPSYTWVFIVAVAADSLTILVAGIVLWKRWTRRNKKALSTKTLESPTLELKVWPMLSIVMVWLSSCVMLIGLALIFIGSQEQNQDPVAWPITVAGLVITAIFWFPLLPGASALCISERGFVLRWCYCSVRSVVWRKVVGFSIKFRHHGLVTIYETMSPTNLSSRRRFMWALLKKERKLPHVCGIEPENLATLLSARRERALALSSEPCTNKEAGDHEAVLL